MKNLRRNDDIEKSLQVNGNLREKAIRVGMASISTFDLYLIIKAKWRRI